MTNRTQIRGQPYFIKQFIKETMYQDKEQIKKNGSNGKISDL